MCLPSRPAHAVLLSPQQSQRWVSVVRSSGHQSLGRPIITTMELGFNSIGKATCGQEPVSAIFCHNQRCVTNHPKPTVLLLALDSGDRPLKLVYWGYPLAAGHPHTSAIGASGHGCPGLRVPIGWPPRWQSLESKCEVLQRTCQAGNHTAALPPRSTA